MSYKLPIIIPIPDPVLLDELIQDIQQDFQANLRWLEYAFGRAKPFNDNGFIEPRVFYSQTTATKDGEYRDVWPNDYWQSHCFFLSEGPETYEDYINIPNARNVWERPISIVFWFNLHRIDSSKNYDFSEELKFDVYTRLKQFRHVELTNFVDNSAEEVFQGFNIQDTDSKNFAYPFTGFRIFANLSGYEQCPPQVILPAPTGLIATTISSEQIDLSWTDNAGGLYAFQVERSLSSGGPFTLIDTTPVGDTTYPNTELDPLTEYFYRVRATDGMGNFSAYSNEASATTNSNVSDEVQAVLDKMPNTVIQADIDKIAAIVNPAVITGVWPSGSGQTGGQIDFFFAPLTDQDNALTSWIGTKTMTNVNSVVYTPGSDWDCNGTTSYLNTNITPSTDLSIGSLNDIHLGIYCKENLSAGGFREILGVDSSGRIRISQTGAPLTRGFLNSNNAIDGSAEVLQSNTRYQINRSAGNFAELLKNNIQVGTNTNVSATLPTDSVYLGCLNFGGTPSSFLDCKVSYFVIGGGLNQSDFNTFLSTVETEFSL